MLLDNLGLFLDVYRNPRRAFSGILDQGSLLFGAGLVVIVSAIMVAGTTAQSIVAAARLAPRPGVAAPSAAAPSSTAAPPDDDEEDDAPTRLVEGARSPLSPYGLVALASLTSSL